MGWLNAVMSLVGGAMSQSGQSSANSTNRDLALQQMLFQKHMSNTAHQREVRDLRLAGLNPILSGTGGQGASSPAGATTHVENEKGAGVNSALDALRTVSQSLLAREQAERTKAETEQTRLITQTKLPAETDLIREQQNSAMATQRNLSADTELKKVATQVQFSEINKNHMLSRLFEQQGINQEVQRKLMNLDIAKGVEVLKGMRNDGAVSDSQFGAIMSYVKRFFDSVPISVGVHR